MNYSVSNTELPCFKHTHIWLYGPHCVPSVFIIVGGAVKGSTPTVKQYLTLCPSLSCPAFADCFPPCCLSWILYSFRPSSINHNLNIPFLHLNSFLLTLSDHSCASFLSPVLFVESGPCNPPCPHRETRGRVTHHAEKHMSLQPLRKWDSNYSNVQRRWQNRTADTSCTSPLSTCAHTLCSSYRRRLAVGRQRSVSLRRKEKTDDKGSFTASVERRRCSRPPQTDPP